MYFKKPKKFVLPVGTSYILSNNIENEVMTTLAVCWGVKYRPIILQKSLRLIIPYRVIWLQRTAPPACMFFFLYVRSLLGFAHTKFVSHFHEKKISCFAKIAYVKLRQFLPLLLGNFEFLQTFVIQECEACNWELLLF